MEDEYKKSPWGSWRRDRDAMARTLREAFVEAGFILDIDISEGATAYPPAIAEPVTGASNY